MKTDYTLWQEREGNLVPVLERPKVDDYTFHAPISVHQVEPMIDWVSYHKAEAAYNESLKVFLPIIGDIEKVRGRVLELNKDFEIKDYGYAGKFAQLIDNKQKVDEPLQEKLSEVRNGIKDNEALIQMAEDYADFIERRGCAHWSGLRRGFIAGYKKYQEQ